MQTETLIVGGGLSGLALADHLTRAGRDFLLAEARPRLGGRVLTQEIGGAQIDLGPAWFWPGQPRIAALLRRFGLAGFEQYASGALLFETAEGQVQRWNGHASMAGSLRAKGGFGGLVEALRRELPQEKLLLSTQIAEVQNTPEAIKARSASGVEITADRIILALPLRLAATLGFEPALARRNLASMAQTATWMAGHAKAVAVYDRPFWRDAGLSGDAMSQEGPLVEIHDASPAEGQVGALFGFIGTPPQSRAAQERLRAHISEQLHRLFGPPAATPVALEIKDWAYDPYTATERDLEPLHAHPQYGSPDTILSHWDGRLLLSGTETAAQFGGFLEGALEASEKTFGLITEGEKEKL